MDLLDIRSDLDASRGRRVREEREGGGEGGRRRGREGGGEGGEEREGGE